MYKKCIFSVDYSSQWHSDQQNKPLKIATVFCFKALQWHVQQHALENHRTKTAISAFKLCISAVCVIDRLMLLLAWLYTLYYQSRYQSWFIVFVTITWGQCSTGKYRTACTSVFAYIVIVKKKTPTKHKCKKQICFQQFQWQAELKIMTWILKDLSICFSEHDDFGGETTQITPKSFGNTLLWMKMIFYVWFFLE